MRVTVAIPTFDRSDVLAVSSSVLNRSPWLNRVNLRVYDDSSTLTTDTLRSLFPTATEIVKRERNLGADDHCQRILADFLKTSDDCLLVLDSDLIVSDKLLDVLLEALPLTDGVLSLYNSCRHRSQQKVCLENHQFELKHTIGAAGLAMTRERVEEIVKQVPAGRSFDGRLAQFVIAQGRRIFVTSHSYVQHIGFDGYNCNEEKMDFGLSFDCDDELTKAAMYRTLERALLDTHQHLDRFHQELGVHVRYTGRIVERSIRRPLKKWLRKMFPAPQDKAKPFSKAA